jgi:hypothetical protein
VEAGAQSVNAAFDQRRARIAQNAQRCFSQRRFAEYQ